MTRMLPMLVFWNPMELRQGITVGEGVYIPRGARLQSCILSSSVHTARVPKSFLRIKIQMLVVGNVCLNSCFEDVR